MVTAPQPTTTATQEDPSQPVVVFNDVSIGFEGKKVLEDISLTVSPGETRILLGPAGSGKSVLLKLVDGLMYPDSGTITVFGEEVSTMPEEQLFQLRGRIGMVFQEGALFDSLTVRDNVAYRLTEQKVPEAEITERVTEALRFVELEQTLDKFPSQLSGGMRRRVAIARAIVNRPDLHPLRFTYRRAGPDHFDYHHRAGYEAARRLPHQFVAGYPSFAGRLHARHTRRLTALKTTWFPFLTASLDNKTTFLVLHDGHMVFDGSTHELVHSDDPFLKEYLS